MLVWVSCWKASPPVQLGAMFVSEKLMQSPALTRMNSGSAFLLPSRIAGTSLVSTMMRACGSWWPDSL
jgi:hypothetical protein